MAKPSHLPPAASPSIRKLTRDLGIDLTRVRGSEHGGRIVPADLKTYIETLNIQRICAKSAELSDGHPCNQGAKPYHFRQFHVVKSARKEGSVNSIDNSRH